MGKRSRSYSSSTGSDDDSDDDRSKRSRRDGHKWRPDKAQRLSVDDDFYTRSNEFRHWLFHDKRKTKDFFKLSNSEQRKYFKKFVRRWNKGKLNSKYYDGTVTAGNKAIGPAAQENIDGASTSSRARLGPSRPNIDDLTMRDEAIADQQAAGRLERKDANKRERREAKREEQENRSTGRERQLEKRAEKREGAREMAQAREQGDMEFSEDFLHGGRSDSFAEAIRRRDASKGHQKREKKQAERRAVNDERFAERQKKEDATMAMFKSLAAARFGSGS